MTSTPRHFKNIRNDVLTDVLNWKTFEKSYEDLCERFGKNKISIHEHTDYFKYFTYEASHLTKAQTNINEIIFNDSMYPRYRALQYVIQKKSIKEAHTTHCPLMDGVDYQEFDYWYHRFSNGLRDFDYDMSNDPMPLAFSDLPIDVIEKIVERAEIKSRYKLREVSRDLQSLVDSSILKIGKISFIVEMYTLTLTVEDFKIQLYCPFCLSFACSLVPLKELMSNACTRLATVIRNPKLQIGSIDIKFLYNYEENKQFVELLKSIPHQLHVRNLKMKVNTKEELMDIILCMKPKILKKFEIECNFAESQIVYGIVGSEQWTQAEEIVNVNALHCKILHFFHFKNFDIRLKKASVDTMLELRDGISKSSNFEWCRIRIRRGPSDEEIQEALELKRHFFNKMKFFIYTIPNSTEILVFTFFNYEIFIKKSTYLVGF